MNTAIVYEWLESYSPELFAELRASGGLRSYLEECSRDLDEAYDVTLEALRQERPEDDEDLLRTEARGMVLREGLPVP